MAKLIRILLSALLILYLAVMGLGYIIHVLFPSSGGAVPYLLALVLIIYLIIAAFYITENNIRITIGVVLGIVLLILAYWIYPDGIMSQAIASATVGDILRLFIVIIFGLALIADVVFLIREIHDY